MASKVKPIDTSKLGAISVLGPNMRTVAIERLCRFIHGGYGRDQRGGIYEIDAVEALGLITGLTPMEIGRIARK